MKADRRTNASRNPSNTSNMLVVNIMTKAVETVAPTALVQTALRKIVDGQMGDLVVTEDGVPVGILTVHDLLKIVAK